ncbi:TonB-linked outer membrane protein, SusC/RagA family [Chitinophaga sp. CF118]|uniref:SusC/RagA family TonB-linked outer membrane protein n=1 Tax=Chitinophaga sp. CF118 TaxID=1884367 RepID=UPI0008F07A73|nr:SusC/RagA family TonB-linked outer membrane protein [Chitinophaga sp. CF118]SFE45384.1 TonB-linked outer membrane protein, SusC/RagA family [Chitinophaga sp. CF118]
MQKTQKTLSTLYGVLLMLFFLNVSTITKAQKNELGVYSRVSLSEDSQPLQLIFKRIKKQSGLYFTFSDKQLDVKERYTIHVKNETVQNVLYELLGEKFKWVADGKIITFFKVSETPLQPESSTDLSTIKGTVTDNSNNPLLGANVRLYKTDLGSSTDALGHFSITTKIKKAVLIITYTGYVQQEISASPDDSIRIRLVPSNTRLDEAVVMAYGITSKRLNTGSISKVSGNEISHQPVTSFLSALQGRITGLVVTQSSGIAGTSFSTQVRGRNSLINASEPLYIIDGVPITPISKKIDILVSIASQNYDEGGISPFNGINPADIESIEVLKDADATAIYGSRGANCVILITTKRGKEGKAISQVSVSTGIGKVAHMEPLLSTPEYLEMRKEALANDGITPNDVLGSVGYAPDLKVWDQKRYVNWQKFLMGGTAYTTDANFNISGGNANTQFFGSTSAHHESSVFPSESDVGYKRGTFDFMLNHKSTDKHFTVDFNGKYSLDNNRLYNAVLASILLPPNAPDLHDVSGHLNWAENGAYFNNPLAEFLKKYDIKTYNALASLKLGYRIFEGLTFRSSFGYNRLTTKENSQNPLSAQNPFTTSDKTSSASFASGNFESYIIEPQLDYFRLFPFGKVSFLVGASWQYSKTSIKNLMGIGYTDEALLNSLDAAASVNTISDNRANYKYAAMFGRLNYNYNDRYIVNISARRDGSSRFGPGKKSNNFGSVGAAWIFTNETFAKGLSGFLDFGKLRGSYGITGNDQIGDYRFLNLWSSISLRPYQNINSLLPVTLFNRDFSWERNKKLTAALELGTFDNRLFASVTYYRNRSDNQLLEYPLPATTGFLTITKNWPAVIINRGWEFELTADIIKKPLTTWTISANLTVPYNRLVSYPEIENSSYSSRYNVGSSVNVLKRLRSSGVDKTTGLFTFEDVNKDGLYDTNDYQVVGKQDPAYYGGVGNSFRFRAFSLDIFLEFKKQTVPNYLFAIYLNNLIPGLLSNQATSILDRWQKEGDASSGQKYTASVSSAAYAAKSNVVFSDEAYSNGAYVKLRNVSLSYTMTKAMADKLRLKQVRFYIQGQNLFTFTRYKGFDPETPYYFSLPPLRTIRTGVQFNF